MVSLSRRSRMAVTSVTALLALSLASCDGRESSPTSLPEKAAAPSTESIVAVVEQAPQETRVYGQPDQYFLELAERHPGFAGIYFDENDELVIATRSGVIPPGLTDIGHPAVSKRAAVAHFSFTTLARWYGAFVDAVATTTWYWTDIDERRNRLVAGVADVTATRNALTDAGVPESVYILEQTKSGTAVKTIRDEFRPVPAGVQNDFAASGEDFGCTNGFNLSHWEFGRTFITASHCTALMAESDGRSFFQPDDDGSVPIGEEVYDEPPFSSSECPNTYCRYSDAAVIQYDSAVSWDYGKIVRTFQDSKSITVDPDNPRHTIVGEELSLMADGSTIIQIGRTDGWSRGEINKTCANRASLVRDDLTLLCQYRSSEGSQPGDSGGPVFKPLPSLDSVTVAGIIIQKDGQFLDTDSWFSPMSGIVKEVKPDSSRFCNGLSTRIDGGCGEGGGGSGGGGGDDCGPFAIQEC